MDLQAFKEKIKLQAEQEENLQKEKLDIIAKNANKGIFKTKPRLNSLFEDVNNANYLLLIKEKIFDFSVYGFLISMVLNILFVFIIFFVMLPLKTKEPYLVTFVNDTNNFGIVQKADSTISANEALRRKLIGAYIFNREIINKIDDHFRMEEVRLQSSNAVWRQLENIVADQKSIYTNPAITRQVKIVNISLKNNTYATADVEITLFADSKIKSIKRYTISLIYEFEKIEIDFASLPKNPTGFIVKRYSITERETLKELDVENRVERKELISKIKRVTKDEEKVLEDAYLYQDEKQKEKEEENLNQEGGE
ncbi:VirB8/TrbF family protein [Helicobacter anatolicus]|nr:VirB8/TrbF family protein [Helicobacter anatolicus]MCE3040026.1 hypothetical protein [Helicobacter anatolicus]